MASKRQTFRLNLSWDTVVPALDRAAARSRHRFAIQDRDNGYLCLRSREGVTVQVHIQVESPHATVISLVGRRTWRNMRLGKGSIIARVLADFRAELEHELAPYKLTG